MYPEGNTATPQSSTGISPSDAALPTEEDMGKVRAFIDQAINAFVNASQLKGEVEELRSSISTLREQVEKVNRQNSWLDEQLVRIRGERDIAISDANSAKQARQLDHDTIETLQRQLDTAKVELGKDADLISQLRKDKDDAEYRAMELEEKLSKVNAKVEKFLSLADEIDPPQEPQQVPITQSWDTKVEPPKVEPASEILPGQWDPDKQAYRSY